MAKSKKPKATKATPASQVMAGPIGPMPITLGMIRIDGDTQPRVRIDTQTVTEYAERIEDGDTLPPIDIYNDGTDRWLADGFHRWHAYQKSGRTQVPCMVHNGTVEDARWHAIGANQTHGLRRTNEDKEKAVRAALKHPQGEKLSDRAIADHVGVGPDMVGKHRKALESTAEIRQLKERTGKDGKTRRIPEKKTPVKPAELDPEPEEEAPKPYKAQKYLDEDGQVIEVKAGLGEWWIVARNGHRLKSKEMPPRKSPSECQADLDSYAKKHDWPPLAQSQAKEDLMKRACEGERGNFEILYAGDVCPECGCIDTAEDEQGLYCRKCKATIGNTPEPDIEPASQPLPAHVQKSRAEQIFLQIQQLFDELIQEKGDAIARVMIENAIFAKWGEHYDA